MINTNDSKLDSLGAIKTFLAGADKIEFAVSKEQRYEWIAGTLKRTGYFLLQKKEKSVIRDKLCYFINIVIICTTYKLCCGL